MTAAKRRADPRRGDAVRHYVLIGSPSLGVGGRSRPTEVFASEADARRRFQRLRLEVGPRPGWAQLMAVEGDEARPLCWFGRPTPVLDDEVRRSRRATRVPRPSPTQADDSREGNPLMATTQLTPEQAPAHSPSRRTTRRTRRFGLGAVLVAATLSGIGVHVAIDHAKRSPANSTVSTVFSARVGTDRVTRPGSPSSVESGVIVSPDVPNPAAAPGGD
jgi:hypothetical protein